MSITLTYFIFSSTLGKISIFLMTRLKWFLNLDVDNPDLFHLLPNGCLNDQEKAQSERKPGWEKTKLSIRYL